MKSSTLAQFKNNQALRHALWQQLATVDAEKLSQQPSKEVWSPNQVLQHLYEAEQGSFKYLQKKLAAPQAKGERAGLASKLRFLVVKTFLALPFKIPAPNIVAHPAQLPFTTIKTQWEQQDEAFYQFLERLPEERFQEAIYRHPLVGTMSLNQMLLFFKDHFLRHQQQILQRI